MDGDAGVKAPADASHADSRGVQTPASSASGGTAATEREHQPSIKDVTLGQLLEFFKFVKEFWMFIAGFAAAVYFGVTYFATATALRQLSCESDARVVNEANQATVLIKSSEKAAFSNQRTTLFRLQNLLGKLQADPKVLKLTPLEEAIEKLIDEAKQNEDKKEAELKLAGDELKASTKAVTACRGDGK